MAKAKIVLTGCLSMSKGRYKFARGVPVTSDDKALIEDCRNDSQFAVHDLEEPKTAKVAGKSKEKDKDEGDEGKKEESKTPPPAGAGQKPGDRK